MHLEIKHPFVLVHDDKPGSHVTLFGTHARFGHGVVRYPFRADQSHFDDATKKYTWAFEATPTHGEVLVCATADRECIGEAYETDSEIGFGITAHERHPLGMRIYRIDGAGNKPLTLI
jgi:hypothetical protein